MMRTMGTRAAEQTQETDTRRPGTIDQIDQAEANPEEQHDRADGKPDVGLFGKLTKVAFHR